eukprot:gene10555-14181_t
MSELVDAAPAANDVDDEINAMFDLTQKKKKKTTKKKATADKTDEKGPDAEIIVDAAAVDGKVAAVASGATIVNGDNGVVFEVDPPAYSYELLLNRVIDLIHHNNPELADKKRFIIKPPQLMRVGTKKTLWVNFQEICTIMRRSADHVFQFMMAELGTEGSIDGNKRLVIRGKFVPKYIESLLRKYIVEYVACQMCRSFNTSLTRDNVSRLYFVQCQDCGSSRSVTQIRAGFHATTRADRRAIKNA